MELSHIIEECNGRYGFQWEAIAALAQRLQELEKKEPKIISNTEWKAIGKLAEEGNKPAQAFLSKTIPNHETFEGWSDVAAEAVKRGIM